MSDILYPPSPKLSDYSFLKPSKAFRRTVFIVALSIVGFILFYFVMVALSILVLVGTVWAAIGLISLYPSFITFAAGFGLIALGVMFFVFLIKFIFSNSKSENPNRIRLNKKDYPELFAFIKLLTADTKAKFPKKIFVSPNVNAMVFYNSGFWSLFFPVRKNLEIGLGLVNSLNVSELKSVLAHEFGHFSQRSMQLGSYIYTVNKAIYNLVYEYDNWDSAINEWAKTGGIFGSFAGITFTMVNMVRGMLKFAYGVINKNYMKLSRQMEYHADLVAISVTSPAIFKNALRKTEFTAFTYDYTVGYLESFSKQRRSTPNLYLNHLFTTKFLASHNGIKMDGTELTITDKDLERNVVKSKVHIEDQWASHPSRQEREENIDRIDISADESKMPAWTLFGEAESLQRMMTQKIYENGFPSIEFNAIDEDEFASFVNREIDKFKVSKIYNGFYDERFLTEMDLEKVTEMAADVTVGEVYSKTNIDLIRKLNRDKIDLEVLNQLRKKQVEVKYFEYEGEKYHLRDVNDVIDQVTRKIEEREKFVEGLDQKSFLLNYRLAEKADFGQELIVDYKLLYSAQKNLKKCEQILIDWQKHVRGLYSGSRLTGQQFGVILAELSSVERRFKGFTKELEISTLGKNFEEEKTAKFLSDYSSGGQHFIIKSEFSQDALFGLADLIHTTHNALSAEYGSQLKAITDKQEKWIRSEGK